jgi:hypothetical protein
MVNHPDLEIFIMTSIESQFSKTWLFLAALALVSLTVISHLVYETNLANASVTCVDKFNRTSIIPCSDQNAMDNMSSTIEPNVSYPNNTSNGINPSVDSLNPAKIDILFFRVDHTSGYIFNTNWVAWGQVENTGHSSSNPISVQIDCTNRGNGAPLYSNTIQVTPSVLAPGQIGKFSQSLSSERDLAGTKYSFDCTARTVK